MSDERKMVEINFRGKKKTKKTLLAELLRENLKKRKVQARNRSAVNKLASHTDLRKSD